MRIDSHQHFWHYNPAEHVWMNEEMGVLKQDILPENLKPLLKRAGFDGTIAVQARQNLLETEWLLGLSDKHDFIKGVVGWVDLRSPSVEEQLAKYSKHPNLKGVRHVVHDEPDDEFMLLPEFLRGLSYLRKYKLTYDLLLFPRHLRVAVQVVKRFPEIRFVLDHVAKPDIKNRIFSPWDNDLRGLASFPNVYCKLSGMVTETTWKRWQHEDFVPYLDIVCDCFGPDRVMVGSDWPVCTLSGEYEDVMQIVKDWVQRFSPEVQEKVLGKNAMEFYSVH